MSIPRRSHSRSPKLFRTLIFLLPVLLLSCNLLTGPPAVDRSAPLTDPTAAELQDEPARPLAAQDPAEPLDGSSPLLAETQSAAEVSPTGEPAPVRQLPDQEGEPAGCLSQAEQAGLNSSAQMLAYADRLLKLPHSLSRRLLSGSWNAYTGQYDHNSESALSLAVDDISSEYLLQDMMDALHVAGFVTWLRDSPQRGLHILALPLPGAAAGASTWQPYIEAYWQSRTSLPQEDAHIVPVLKRPPCGWMVEAGSAPRSLLDWSINQDGSWPDYARAASAYLARTTDAAARVAGRIDWLGPLGQEGPNTMCGPLVWSIMNDAGALPPGYGGWSQGAKSFWLARPRTNGRPWTLFPPGSYQVYSFREPLGEFEFRLFPLYPGDFLYTYSKGDGYDHMLLITEVDQDGNVYTVTNRVHVLPESKTTIERVLLLNLNDLTTGIARQVWHMDRKNGRTGHNGFDVFRWDWMEKDVLGEAALYTVGPGDTLSGIAERWKTPADRIAVYNKIAVDAALQVDQDLFIPPNDNPGGS